MVVATPVAGAVPPSLGQRAFVWSWYNAEPLAASMPVPATGVSCHRSCFSVKGALQSPNAPPAPGVAAYTWALVPPGAA